MLPLQNPVIDVAVADASPAGWPATLGVPFTPGMLHDPAQLSLIAPDDEVRPLAARDLLRWPDGSVRWALLAFGARVTGEHTVALQSATPVANEVAPVQLTQGAEGMTLDNGLVRVELATGGAGPIHRIEAHGATLLDTPQQFQLRAGEASTAHETTRTLLVLENSPQRVRVRVEGGHFKAEGERCLSYRLDVELWAGWPSLRLDYNFINEEPGHEELQIENIAIAFQPQLGGEVQRHFRQMRHGHFTRPREVHTAEPVAIRADKTRSSPYIEEWPMMQDDGHYPPYLRQLVVDTAPWLGLVGGERSVYMEMQEFAAMRPGRIVSEGGELLLEVWPAAAGPLALPQGRSRRQTITLAFPATPDADTKLIEQLLHAPLHEGRAGVVPQWFRQTATFEQDKVLEPGTSGRFERYLTRLMVLDTPMDMFDLGDTIENYTNGSINGGRKYLKHGVAEPPNPMLVASAHGAEWVGNERFEPVWTNNEYDGLHALCSEIMRNQRHDLWKTLRLFARHNIEVDFIYYSDDPWQHHGSPAHSAYHRMASAYPSHMWTQGLLEYYCLTGDPDALEVATRLGDTIMRNFADAERRPLLWGFNREIGWPVLALVYLADITGEERFQTQAAEFADFLMNFDRAGNKNPVNLSGVNPRHSMDRQIAGSFFGYACMVEGLNYYAALHDDQELRTWLIELLTSLREAVWEMGGTGHGSGFLLCQGMAIGYELTGDDEFLDAGMLFVEQLMDSNGWHSPAASVKPMATNYRAYIRTLHHAQRAGLLEEKQYPSLLRHQKKKQRGVESSELTK